MVGFTLSELLVENRIQADGKTLENVGDVKLSSLERAAFLRVAARREGRVAGDAEREFSGRPRTSNGRTNSSKSVEEFRGCSLEKSLSLR